MIKNPFFLKNDSIISFSGGRTSGFMLKKILEAHENVLPKNCHVVFANTGKEIDQTYNFVEDCQNKWNVKINWIEFDSIQSDGYKPNETF